MTLFDQVMEATVYVQSRSSMKPAVGVILGSGLGDLAAEVQDAAAIPYEEIPHFLRSTVVGHAGRLLIGKLENVPVVVMQGRFHFYEGYDASADTPCACHAYARCAYIDRYECCRWSQCGIPSWRFYAHSRSYQFPGP